MMKNADLHLHTIASADSVLDPERAFLLARQRDLAVVSFADHESTASHKDGLHLSVIHGVEFLRRRTYALQS